MTLTVGEEAPDFLGPCTDGEDLRLSKFRGQRHVVLFFYPGDFTPVCTTQACGFKELARELADKAIQMIGISTDSLDTHRRFASAYNLCFPLVSDRDQSISKKFEATNLLFAALRRSRRVTYVIDVNGRIVSIIRGDLSARVHLDGVRAAVAKLPQISGT